MGKKSIDVLYVNTNNAKKMMSNTVFKEDHVYQAHSLETYGFIPYVKKEKYDKIVSALINIDSPEAKQALKDLGEI